MDGSKGIQLTPKFLGETDEACVPAIEQRLRTAAFEAAPFALCLGRFGAFPSLGCLRVLWLGVAGDVQRLASLQGRVEQELAWLGFPPEDRPFFPYLTFGRGRPQQRPGAIATVGPDAAGVIRPVVQPVRPTGLIESRLASQGAVYTRLVTFLLRG